MIISTLEAKVIGVVRRVVKRIERCSDRTTESAGNSTISRNGEMANSVNADDNPETSRNQITVSYTHLTLPTKA